MMAMAQPGTVQAERSPKWARLAWLGIIVLYVGLRLPLLAVPLERDEGAFGVLGTEILRGGVPYRDIFDHKPPGAFYLYAGALFFIPPTAVGVHLFLLAWNLATLLCLGSLAHALGGWKVAVWSGLAFSVVNVAPSVQGFSTTTEMLLLLPLVASLRLTVAGIANSASRDGTFALAGLLGGVACWIKQPAVLPLLATFLLIYDGGSRDRRNRALAVWLLGALSVGLLVSGYFLYEAGWTEFWYWTVQHNRLYAALPVSHAVDRATAGFANVLLDAPLFVVASLVGAYGGLHTRREGSRFALTFLVLSVAAVFHSRFFYLHYFALLVPAVCLASGLGLARIQESFGGGGRAVQGLVVVATLVLALAVPLASRPWYWRGSDPTAVLTRLLGPQGADADEQLAEYIRTHTRPDERIFVYGSEPQIGFLAARRDLNPFVTVYPLTWTWPRHREFQERVWRAIERTPPAYIIVSRLANSLVRSPSIDPFLEQHLSEMGRREYHFEVAVVADASGLHLSSALPAPSAAGAAASVIGEVWRRNDHGAE